MTQTASQTASRTAVVVVLFRIVGVVFQAAVVVLLANRLSIVDMGIFSATYVFWGLARMLGPVGHDQLGLREIAGARAKDQHPYAAAVYGHVSWIAACIGAAVALATAVALVMVGARLSSALSWQHAILIALAVPAFTLIGVQMAAARGFDRNISSQAIEAFGLHGATGLMLLVHLMFAELTLTAVLLWMALFAWLTVLTFFAMLRPSVGDSPDTLPLESRRRLWREGFEVWHALVLIGLASRAPTYITLTMLGPAETALLEVAIRFGTLPTIFTTGVTATFAPLLAGLSARGDKAALKSNLAVSSWLSFIPAVCTLLGAAVLGQWLLATFFPAAYQASYLPLLIVILATTVNGGYGMSSVLLLMTGHQKMVRQYSAVQFAFVTCYGILFGYFYGLVGIAAGLLLGFIVFDVGLALQVPKVLGVNGFLHLHGLRTLISSLLVGHVRTWETPSR